MNCLYGMYDSYEGEIWFNGQKVVINDPKQAIALGIGMVHQHFMLIPAPDRNRKCGSWPKGK